MIFFLFMIRRPPKSTQGVSSAASDVYKRQIKHYPVPTKIKLKEIKTTGLKNISHEFVVSQLGFSAKDSVTVEQVNQGLRKLLGTRFLDQARYELTYDNGCLLYTSPSPRDLSTSRMPSSA
eukprot:TRINITY_DN46294_c0_g1_i1.p2 TRINITY_DN46294_c0_g1~~TRINITY_DN46294_c0_g1_i1.p2  ORF type:complete len:121 (-),score=28.20 TRINITY_DN46294_c0_g1_i1:71-433(-)